jgi:uncharacterized phage-associated protein
MRLLPFNEVKATQAASLLLRLHGGQMNYMKLIKLLYLLDRTALLRWGRPVTTDRHVSMPRGPVVSNIYNLILEEPPPGLESPWHRHISEPQSYTVGLVSDPGNTELSLAEEDLINEIFREHGRKSQWALVDLCHALPEWQDPDGSAIPIGIGDILRAGDRTEAEIAAIEDELANLATVKMLVSAT